MLCLSYNIFSRRLYCPLSLFLFSSLSLFRLTFSLPHLLFRISHAALASTVFLSLSLRADCASGANILKVA